MGSDILVGEGSPERVHASDTASLLPVSSHPCRILVTEEQWDRAREVMEERPVAEAESGPRRLKRRIRESDQQADDQRLLEDISRLLVEYRGDDEVILEIAIDGRIVTLDWPLARVRICAPLEEGIRQLLGPAGYVSIEDIAR